MEKNVESIKLITSYEVLEFSNIFFQTVLQMKNFGTGLGGFCDNQNVTEKNDIFYY